MKLEREIIEWVERKAEEIRYGQVVLTITVREGEVKLVEKAFRETEVLPRNAKTIGYNCGAADTETH